MTDNNYMFYHIHECANIVYDMKLEWIVVFDIILITLFQYCFLRSLIVLNV